MNGDIRIASTANDYEKLRQYSRATDTRIVWNDLSVQCEPKADLLLVISHARSTIGSKMLQAKMTAIRMTSVQFNLLLEHKGVIGPHSLKFDLSSLDDIEEPDRYPKDFQVVIELELQTHCSNGSKISSKSHNFCDFVASFEPICLFSNERELEECHNLFASNKDVPQLVSAKSAKPVRPPPPVATTNTAKEEEANTPLEQFKPKDNLFDALQWDVSEMTSEGQLTSKTIDNNRQSKDKKPLVTDLLLNLSIDETLSETQNSIKSEVKQEIPSDLFGTSDPQIDLIGNIADLHKDSAHDSNINLLNDINLCPTDPIIPSMAAFDSTPLNVLKPNIDPKNSGPTLTNSSVPLQRNTSTPNLTKLDPLAQLGSFMSTASGTSAKTNTTSIPRVASYSTFQFPNVSASQTSRPDYSRTHFDVKNSTATSASASSKVFGNEFEDLLGGFKPSSADNMSKSIAQMRKEEMVFHSFGGQLFLNACCR